METVIANKDQILLSSAFLWGTIAALWLVFIAGLVRNKILPWPVLFILVLLGVSGAYYQFDQHISSKWFGYKAGKNELNLHFADNQIKEFACLQIDSIRPRFEKNACNIVVRLDGAVFSSGDVSKIQCKDLISEIETKIDCVSLKK